MLHAYIIILLYISSNYNYNFITEFLCPALVPLVLINLIYNFL